MAVFNKIPSSNFLVTNNTQYYRPTTLRESCNNVSIVRATILRRTRTRENYTYIVHRRSRTCRIVTLFSYRGMSSKIGVIGRSRDII